MAGRTFEYRLPGVLSSMANTVRKGGFGASAVGGLIQGRAIRGESRCRKLAFAIFGSRPLFCGPRLVTVGSHPVHRGH